MRYPVIFAAAFLFGHSSAVSAQELNVESDTVQACLDHMIVESGRDRTCIGDAANDCQLLPGGSTTPGIAACLGQEAGIWDDLLNAQYGILRERMRNIEAGQYDATSEELLSELREAQLVWIAFRDADCRFRYSQFQGGTMRSVVGASCRLDKTANRVLDLYRIGGAF